MEFTRRKEIRKERKKKGMYHMRITTGVLMIIFIVLIIIYHFTAHQRFTINHKTLADDFNKAFSSIDDK
jgi:succinate dehydrogenase hydrophobic anchor subunit